MYANVISLKSGKAIPFQSKVPYSADKVAEGWNILTDEVNGEYISIRGSEIASICSQEVKKIPPEDSPDVVEKEKGSRKSKIQVS